MEEQDLNGQKRQQRSEREPTAVSTLLLGATIAASFGGLFLIVGLTVALTNGYKVGPYAAFAGGLAASIIGSVMIHGGVALTCHRLQIKGNAKCYAEIRELNRNMRAIIALLADRKTSDDDQVGAARRSREN